jgi:hypothetical protein
MSPRKVANESSQMASETSQFSNPLARRAGRFLDEEYPGSHRNKRIARALEVSPGTAKNLRAGRGWTVPRLDEAARLYGARFLEAVFGPAPAADELRRDLDDITRRLAALERRPQS